MASETSFFSSIVSSIADFLPTAHAEEKSAVEGPDSADSETEKDEEEAPAEEEEEEEPEDLAPGIKEACGNAKPCASFKHHFEECAERISAGKTQIHGENCVEELFHFMHCVDDCAAPKIFASLK